MSINTMKQVLEAIQDLRCYRPDIDAAINALRTAIQQAESEPVYWEWRHQGSHPDSVDFGQWSEWKRVEPRSALHTVEDALNEFRGYITRGHKYELRSLYTHPAPGVPDGYALVPIEPTPAMMKAGCESISCIGSCGEASPPEVGDFYDVWVAMLSAKEK